MKKMWTKIFQRKIQLQKTKHPHSNWTLAVLMSNCMEHGEKKSRLLFWLPRKIMVISPSLGLFIMRMMTCCRIPAFIYSQRTYTDYSWFDSFDSETTEK